MQYRKLVIFLYLLLFSISLFAQEHPFDCENFRVGQTYTGQQLTIRLRTIKKDFEIYSVYGYFDKSLEVLNSQLESYGVAQKEREQIIKQIRKMTGWSGKKLQEYGLKEPQNSELISIFNHFDFTFKTIGSLNTSHLAAPFRNYAGLPWISSLTLQIK